MRRPRLLGSVIVCALLHGVPARAQIDLDKATLSGTVRDETGGVLVGALVVVTNSGTGALREGLTDETGVYRVPALTPGTYEVRIERSGFGPTVYPEVSLTLGQRGELDVVLRIARADVKVVVDANASVVETARLAQATTLTQTEIQHLPINQRNFLEFALLTPGVTAANPLATPTPTNSPSSGLSIAGQDQRSNDVTIDGADNMDAAVGAVRSTLSQDAVQEFQVLRSTFSAEFGRARAGVVNIVSKSGSNVAHGGGFSFFRDDALDARNAFAFDAAGRSVNPPFRRYQYGTTLGGPIVRDRVFAFASYEGLRRRESTFVSVLQSDQILRATASQQRLFNALAASGDPQLQLLASTFIQPATGLLNTTAANFPGTLDLLQRESGVFPFASSSHTASFRLDGNLSNASQLTGRINFNNSTTAGNDIGGLRGVSSGTNNATRNFASVVSHTHVLSGNTVNIVRAQYGHFHTAVLPTDASGPGIVIGGIAQVGRDLFNPTDYAWNIFQGGDAWLHSHGPHELKVGVDLLSMRSRNAKAEVFLAGQFQFAEAIPLAAIVDGVFGPGTTAAVGARLGSPAAAGGLGRPELASDLLVPITSLQAYNLGLPVVYLQGFGDPTTNITNTQLAMFLQDEIRLRSGLTLSGGLRYDTDWRDPSVNTAGSTAPFDLQRSVIADRNNVAPRVGAAYAFGSAHRTVVRGGWGLFYQNALTVLGFSSRVLSGQISQVFLPLTGLPGVTGTSADVWQRYQRDGHVGLDTLQRLGIAPGTTPSVLLIGRDRTPDAVSSQASVGIEREITENLSVAAEYTHNRGYNIIRLRDMNVQKVGHNQFTLPGLDPRFLQLNTFEGTGRSSYHGVSLSVRKRYSRRWGLAGSYTVARARDDVTDFTLETEPQDQTDLNAEWGPSTYDQRHRLVASAVYVSPPDGRWLANWSVAPILTYASGRPFNLLLGYDGNGDAHTETDRARLTNGESVGRNTGAGPNLFTTDLRIARQVNIGQRRRLELSIDAFNLFNRTNYSGVNRVFGNQTLVSGQVTGNKDLPPTQPLGFSSAYPARQLQIGARLEF
jgi:hypothetical protein